METDLRPKLCLVHIEGTSQSLHLFMPCCRRMFQIWLVVGDVKHSESLRHLEIWKLSPHFSKCQLEPRPHMVQAEVYVLLRRRAQ